MSYGVLVSNIANSVNRFEIDAGIVRGIARSFWVDLQNTLQAAGKIKIFAHTDGGSLEEVKDFDEIQVSRGFEFKCVLRIKVEHIVTGNVKVEYINLDLPVEITRSSAGHQNFHMMIGAEGRKGGYVFNELVDNDKNPTAVSLAAKALVKASDDWVCESVDSVTILV
ncbi:hypothetical protein QZM64_24070 [Burkholderia cepacia]|uniref:hypothetical protein n=1 Tax=Burkholderia cepacia TaxID=292 RepID=UPI00264D1A9C|nr:hypothetical protein [Burkholderia cepacia]MDN7442240.1 hypothetical protein [Burkholderia cepacia]